MGEHNSPFFTRGAEDGARDNELIASCPPSEPYGMDPEADWSAMYRRGYERTYEPGMAHVCTRECQK